MGLPSTATLSESYEPLITIAIPTFNRATLLQGCLEAAFQQSYGNIEVLVSDNASTDETGKLLKGVSDRRLRVLTQDQNVGLLPNWNTLLREARGEFIIFVPDDDRIGPRMLANSILLVKSAPQVSIVLSLFDTYLMDENRTIGPVRNRELATGVYEGFELLRGIFKHRIRANMCTVLIRTDALRARGGFPNDMPYSADVAAWWPLLLTGKAGFINEPCGRFSVHPSAETSRLALNTKIADVRKAINLVIHMADVSIKDSHKQRAFESEANHFFARFMVGLLRGHLYDGHGLADAFRLLWQWRRQLGFYGVAYAMVLVRPITAQALPAPVVSRVRQVMRIFGS